jgi:hypothetical protein
VRRKRRRGERVIKLGSFYHLVMPQASNIPNDPSKLRVHENYPQTYRPVLVYENESEWPGPGVPSLGRFAISKSVRTTLPGLSGMMSMFLG